MYHAMTSLGFAAESRYQGPIRLDGDPKGTSVLILGAGTGLGVSGLIPSEDGWIALGTEGGHASFAPRNEELAPALKSIVSFEGFHVGLHVRL